MRIRDINIDNRHARMNLNWVWSCKQMKVKMDEEMFVYATLLSVLCTIAVVITGQACTTHVACI